MQQGGDKVVTVTRGGDGGVKKSFPQVLLPNASQQSMLLQSMLNRAW